LENRLVIEGELVESDALRYTPAGVPILKFRLAHRSKQSEGGGARDVGCELDAVAFEAQARLLATAPLGTSLKIEGFLDRKTRSGRAVVLHANQIEFVVTKKT
jgi:primosomal replication protein N